MPIILFCLCAFLFIYVELSLLIWVGTHIGVLGVILLLLLSGLVGLSMIRSRGIYTILNVRQQLARGEIPARALLQSVIWIISGILLIIPGFLTDIFALLLLLPPVRLMIESVILRKVTVISSGFWRKTTQQFHSTAPQDGEIIDAEFEREVDEQHQLK